LHAGNFFSRIMQDTTVTTDMQVIQMPGPMKIDLEVVWIAVMIRGVCRVVKAAAAAATGRR
jgi:hypothetical protein